MQTLTTLTNAMDPSKLKIETRGNALFPITITKKSLADALVLVFAGNAKLAFMIDFETSVPTPTIRSLYGDVSALTASVDGTTLTITHSTTDARLWGASLIIVAER